MQHSLVENGLYRKGNYPKTHLFTNAISSAPRIQRCCSSYIFLHTWSGVVGRNSNSSTNIKETPSITLCSLSRRKPTNSTPTTPPSHYSSRLTISVALAMATATGQYLLRTDPTNGSGSGSASGSPSRQHSQPAASVAGQPQHKRVYQACIPCRRRKVKCDLGSVDSPGDPPCVRCRRESKECFFSPTRRKRKTEDGKENSLDGYDNGDDYIVRNGRKMPHTSPPVGVAQGCMGAPTSARSDMRFSYEPVMPAPPLTPGGSIGRTQPLRRPGQSADGNPSCEGNSAEANTQLENLEAQEVMRREVYGPHDALDLLYKAATNG